MCNKLRPFGDQSLDLNCTSEFKKKKKCLQLSSLLLVARPSAGRAFVKFMSRTDNKDSVFCSPYSVRDCLPDLDLVKHGVLTRVGEIRLCRNDRYHY